MNIFTLDENLNECTKYYVDSHVSKMILETAQLLCTVHWVLGDEAPYKPTHINHPCSLWVRESLDNYVWLCRLGMAISKEYIYRRNKSHASQKVIEWCMNNTPNLPSKGLTPQPLCMPEDCKVDDVVESYRNYYRKHKQHLFKWTNRNKPEWIE